MITINGQRYPLVKSNTHYNSVLFSPWTGKPWAWIDRGQQTWFAGMVPSEGERPWPLPESVPGSLVTSYDIWRYDALEELPTPVLLREVSVLERLTRATLSTYNGATNGEYPMTPELLQEIASLRTKVESNTITDQELRDALKKMREGRISAGTRAAASKKVVANPDDALAAFLS